MYAAAQYTNIISINYKLMCTMNSKLSWFNLILLFFDWLQQLNWPDFLFGRLFVHVLNAPPTKMKHIVYSLGSRLDSLWTFQPTIE